MKRSIFLFLIPVLFFSCKKKNTFTDPSVNTDPFSYSMEYDTVTTAMANSTFYFSFNIKVLTGSISSNQLTCSVEGLPLVAVTPSSMVVGYLKGGVFKFDIGLLAPGNYPFKLKVKGEKTGEQQYNLILKIVLPPDYAPLLADTYPSCYDFCSASGFVYYSSEVKSYVDTPYLLTISNVKNYGVDFVVRAQVSDIITIPAQEVSGKTIWGRGTYSKDGRPGHSGEYVMAIADTIVTGIDTQVCTIHIEH